MQNNETSPRVGRGSAIVGMIVTFVGGYFIGHITHEPTVAAPASKAATAKRTAVPVGLSPVLGPADALVTIVEFADFQCGFCSRSVGLQKRVMADFPGRVRWVFKHFPLPNHPAAQLASEASMAAHQEGQFWDYHHLVFSDRRNMGRKALDKYAMVLGLDMTRFKSVLDNGTMKSVVEADKALATKLGVRGTPNFFVNGRRQVGSFSYRRLNALIKQEIRHARALMDRGVKRSEIYEQIVQTSDNKSDEKAATTGGADAKEQAAAGPPRPRVKVAKKEASASDIYRLPGTGGPHWGAEDAPLTLVLFSDFQCKHSAELFRTLAAVRRTFGDGRLRLLFRHFPMARNQHAWLAAQASLAADAQGKFWAYADLLFDNQASLPRAVLVELAAKAGLDLGQFESDLDSGRFAEQVEADMNQAVQFGCIGTPSFFVNGRYGRGARTLEQINAILVGELRRAKEAEEQGVPREKIYEHMTQSGKNSV